MPNFHKILQRVGKTSLRPGGTASTQKLLEWSGLTADDSVLELSAGLGKTGILFAQAVGCQVLITDLDEGRLELAEAQVQEKKLSKIVQTKKMNMFHITQTLGSDAHFDCAMTEAALTHYPLEKKREFFQGLVKHTHQCLLHEIFFVTESPEVQKSVSREMQGVLKIGFFPETSDTWQQLLQDAGFTVHELQVGPIALLNPATLLKDEGPMGVANILKNIMTQPYLRSRVWATRQALGKHSPNHLGYIILRTTKSNDDNGGN
jgi:cyclopropane fatty-acyl-phospholipid synthase-like methyltransferase